LPSLEKRTIEQVEADLWIQYAELGGATNQGLSPIDLSFTTGLAPNYITALEVLDGDMPQYIADNTDENAVPDLAKGQHPAIPLKDGDLVLNADGTIPTHLQAIANTAGFHFAFIEQGGSSLYPALAQKVSNLEVMRILLSIGGSEIAHFQTWHDKAGNATNITDGNLTFLNLNIGVDPNNGATGPNVADQFQTNLIMPEAHCSSIVGEALCGSDCAALLCGGRPDDRNGADAARRTF
jgi:hypothetical protein